VREIKQEKLMCLPLKIYLAGWPGSLD